MYVLDTINKIHEWAIFAMNKSHSNRTTKDIDMRQHSGKEELKL